MIRERLPFKITKNDNFYEKFGEWIGDVFYDILPEKGFELRDEQIFMAFQLERAFKDKAVTFAEAGVGTGKTIVYLLYAICYARYIGKPAIISCADESLIEQLVKKEGDIAKLSEALDLNIDVRLAKSQDQYLCLEKLDKAIGSDEEFDKLSELHTNLPDFVNSHGTLQTFYHYGDRKDYPLLNDEEWNKVSWDHFQDCFACPQRHRCGQTLSRDFYRKSTDIIICSHDFYMEHVWTIDARKREGQLPLLPESSCVVFDEGHLLEFSAQKALTYRVNETSLETLLTRLLENDIREEFAYLIEDTLERNNEFFEILRRSTSEVVGSTRMDISFTKELNDTAKLLHKQIVDVGENLVFESETYTINHYDLNIVDEYIDQMEYSLKLLIEENDVISWVESVQAEQTLVIMPRAVEDILSEKVFSKDIPFIFSSATLSENQSFDYIASSLGIEKYQSFSVESPFDYDQQMELHFPLFKNDAELFNQKLNYSMNQLEKTEGRALVLFNSKRDLLNFKAEVGNGDKYQFLFEGEQEISELVSTFQNNEKSILCSVHLWEGLDIPGPSLSNVIIWSLPFPPNDPVFQAKRKSVEHAFDQVDIPYMMLRLRQGVGRLIRTHSDKGIVSILGTEDIDKELYEKILTVLPTTLTKMGDEK